MAERITINPITEATTNAPLELVGLDDSHGIYLLDHQYPEPAKKSKYAEHPAYSGGRPIGPPAHELGQRPVLKLRISEPRDPASTNLITNPKCAIDTTGYTLSGANSVTRTVVFNTAIGAVPEAGADTAAQIVTDAAGDHCYHEFAATSGTTYTASFWLHISALTATAVKLQVKNASGTDKAATSNQTTVGEWVRISVTFAADSTSNWRLAAEQVGAGGATLYITGLMVEASATLSGYFDGDTPGCSFSGARHASTSTRPAPGGPRYWAIRSDIDNALSLVTQRQYGTYRRVPREGAVHTFDLTEVDINPTEGIIPFRCDYDIKFVSQPYARMPEITGSVTTENTNPVLILEQDAPPGDVPALGKLTVNELEGVNQAAIIGGLQVENYSTDADAALFYECETRTPLGTAATNNGPTGASGPSNPKTILDGSLTTTWRAIMSTQAAGGGNDLEHIGDYRLWLRVQCPSSNAGAVQVRLSASQNDFTDFTQNDPVNVYPDATNVGAWEDTWRLLDLGVIRLKKNIVSSANQKWRGHILAKSTIAGDDIYLDHFFLEPVGECAFSLIVSPKFETPTTFIARDEFAQSAGNLAGKVLPSGQTWTDLGGGSGTDFTMDTTGATAQRTATGDAVPRVDTAGTTTYAAVVVQADIKFSAQSGDAFDKRHGVVARASNLNQIVRAVLLRSPFGTYLELQTNNFSTTFYTVTLPTLQIATWYSIRLYIDANGTALVWFWQTGTSEGDPYIAINETRLATGGGIASGKVGIYDNHPGATALTRNWDNFIVFAPTSDAAIFANNAAQIRYDGAVREADGVGTQPWVPKPIQGNLLYIPPATREKRKVRALLKGVRFNPTIGPDSGIDNVSAQLDTIPRVLHVPKT